MNREQSNHLIDFTTPLGMTGRKKTRMNNIKEMLDTTEDSKRRGLLQTTACGLQKFTKRLHQDSSHRVSSANPPNLMAARSCNVVRTHSTAARQCKEAPRIVAFMFPTYTPFATRYLFTIRRLVDPAIHRRSSHFRHIWSRFGKRLGALFTRRRKSDNHNAHIHPAVHKTA